MWKERKQTKRGRDWPILKKEHLDILIAKISWLSKGIKINKKCGSREAKLKILPTAGFEPQTSVVRSDYSVSFTKPTSQFLSWSKARNCLDWVGLDQHLMMFGMKMFFTLLQPTKTTTQSKIPIFHCSSVLRSQQVV